LIGAFYYFGTSVKYDDVKQDYSKAFEYLEKACNIGNSFSCYIIGSSYDYDRGVKQDKDVAKYYDKACDLDIRLTAERNKKDTDFTELFYEAAQSLKYILI
jgi:TPR repeat protein